jgi:multidrug efflux pump subunit AcrB
VAQLPPRIAYEWNSVSYEQQQSTGQAGKLYGVSIIVVLLCLAAWYERWSIPFAVMLVVPLGVLGAILATNRLIRCQAVSLSIPERPLGR